MAFIYGESAHAEQQDISQKKIATSSQRHASLALQEIDSMIDSGDFENISDSESEVESILLSINSSDDGDSSKNHDSQAYYKML